MRLVTFYTIHILLALLVSLILHQSAFAQQDGDLVELTSINPAIRLDIRYATDNNFLKQAVYPQARCFLRYKAAVKLDSIQRELETIGLGLKVFDGYRPLSVQRKLWAIFPDNRYVADPQKGSRHNRGAAVDLTLVTREGEEVPMPTGYDDFTEKAHHDYMDLDGEILINRWILRTIMEKYGFIALNTEWWHYDLKSWEQFDLLDIDFDAISSPSILHKETT